MIKTWTKNDLLQFSKKLEAFKKDVKKNLDRNSGVKTDTCYMQKLHDMLDGFWNQNGNDWIDAAGYETKQNLIDDLTDKLEGQADSGEDTMDTSMDLSDVRNSDGKWFDISNVPVDNSEIIDTASYVQLAIKSNLPTK